MGSSNTLFPDSQSHCSNGFSIIDNFKYGMEKKKSLFATDVKASYSVISWISKPQKDIFKPQKLSHGVGGGSESKKTQQTREQRFRDLKLAIKGFQDDLEPMPKYSKAIADWFAQTEGVDKDPATRSLCHGAMHDVHRRLTEAPKTVLADHHAWLLCEAQPVAVETTHIAWFAQ